MDGVSEEKLDLVDAIVFDTAVSKKLRQVKLFSFECSGSSNFLGLRYALNSQEALVFFFDHTEGFESLENDEQAEIDKSQISSAASKRKRFAVLHARFLQ